MFCKNCGAQIEDNAKFCTSCGAKVEASEPVQEQHVEEQYHDTYTEQNTHQEKHEEEVPWQFSEGHRNIGESGTSSKTFYEKKFFKGKAVGTSASGSISFGSGERKGFLGKILKFGAIAVVAIIAISLLLGGNSGPVNNLTTTDLINIETYEPVGEVDEFDDWIDEIYITFTTNGLEVGQVVRAEFYIEDTYIGYNSLTAGAESENMFFSHVKPDSGWMLGYVYRVEIFIDGEFVDSTTYMFE